MWLDGPRAGKVAGSRNAAGYWQITIDGINYYGHRLAVLYMTGEWPEVETDHRDLNKTNNRWRNLRKATTTQNQANSPLYANNTSGIKGVTYCKRTQKWLAQIGLGGKCIFLGRFIEKSDAAAAVSDARQRYHGEFARAA